MDKMTAYRWVGNILEEIFETNTCWGLADKMASAIKEAYKQGQQESMTDKEFRAFLDFMMCSDPWPVCDKHGVVDLNSQLTLLSLADRESEKRGFVDWIDAFHLFMKPRAIVGSTSKE